MYPDLKLFIAGKWRKTKEDITVINPATEEELGRLPCASIKDLDDALEAAVKGFEIEFAALSKGDIARGTKFVPTRHMKKDRFGNVSQSNLTKIVNSVGNTGRTGSNIFIGRPRGGSRTPGVYRRERNQTLRALFLAVQPGQYPARFPAVRVIETSVTRSFGPYLRQALAKNVANEVRMANRGSF